MRMGLKTILTIAVLALVPAAQAQVNDGPDVLELDKPEGPAEIRGVVQAQPIALFFAGLDTNRDKVVTRLELSQGIAADWAALKPSVTNKVGAFKMEDWALETLGSREAYPTRLSFDSNLDNQVSADEFANRLNRTFDDRDKNDDGRLTREELVSIVAPRIVRKEARSSSRDNRREQERPRRN